jgi:hypothetical protein
MPAFKPDSSFFEKIVRGAVGCRAVAQDLNRRGHRMVELERGSTDTKLWKDVKRKRVRIPDLVCSRCGVRVESRAKQAAILSMSHSATENERSWNFGMVDADWVAFPVVTAADLPRWSNGRFNGHASYWHERSWARWQAHAWVNYFTVGAFAAVPFVQLQRKGVTEGSELTIGWPATFSNYDGTVTLVAEDAVSVCRAEDGRNMPRRKFKAPQRPVVAIGDRVTAQQVLASAVAPLTIAELECRQEMSSDHIRTLLASRQRTQRFTGVKLARVRQERQFCNSVRGLFDDAEEDIYVRLEALSYLAEVCGESAGERIQPFLNHTDPQTRLEAVITLGETPTDEVIQLLSDILHDVDTPYFLRSAAAWGLGHLGGNEPARTLIRAFSAVNPALRQEALDAIVMLGTAVAPLLVDGLRDADDAISSGCAEALRQQSGAVPVERIAQQTRVADPSRWAVWLLGMLPRETVAVHIAKPEVHYAVSLLWAFAESWIARRWEFSPGPEYPENTI